MPYSEVCHPSRPQSENQRKLKERQVFGIWQRTEKVVEYESDSNTNRRAKNVPRRIGKEDGSVEYWVTNRDQPNYSHVEIGRNFEKIPVDLRRLAVSQTPSSYAGRKKNSQRVK